MNYWKFLVTAFTVGVAIAIVANYPEWGTFTIFAVSVVQFMHGYVIGQDDAKEEKKKMCLLCVEIAKGSMTKQEVDRALREFKPDDPHIKDIKKLAKSAVDESRLNVIQDYFPVHDEFNGFGEYGDE